MSVCPPVCHSSSTQKLLKWLTYFSQSRWRIKTSALLRSWDYLESRHLTWRKRFCQCSSSGGEGMGLAESLWHFVGLLWVYRQAEWNKTRLHCSQLSQIMVICAFTGACYEYRLHDTAGWRKSKCLDVNTITADVLYSFGTAIPLPPLWKMLVKLTSQKLWEPVEPVNVDFLRSLSLDSIFQLEPLKGHKELTEIRT